MRSRTSARTGAARARAFSAPVGERLLQGRLVGAQLLVALADGRQQPDHPVGHRLLEVAVAGPLELALDRVVANAAHRGEDVDQVRHPRLVGRADDLAAGVGDGAAELLADRLLLVEHENRPRRGTARRRHLPFRLLQIHDPRPDLGDAQLRHHQRLAEALVEAAGDLAHQLDVLALVVADRHLGGAVGEHVGGHQHRVEEERRRDQLLLLGRLVLELVHAVEVAVRGDGGEHPGQLGVLAHVGLAEEDAALGVEAGGEQDRGRVVDPLAQLRRVVGDRERVQVDDAEDRRLAPLLPLDVLLDRADVVAQVLAAGRLDTPEDDRGCYSQDAAYSGDSGRVPLAPTKRDLIRPRF